MNFDADTLRALRDVKEVTIRSEKHPKSAVVIWVVVADNDVFVRSWLGNKGRWHRDLAEGGRATLEFGARRLAVRAIPASDPIRSPGSAANSCENTSRVPMHRRWCAPKSCQPRCGSNRTDRPLMRRRIEITHTRSSEAARCDRIAVSGVHPRASAAT
jgi:hypothetical protein